jgi:hypothetical protein
LQNRGSGRLGGRIDGRRHRKCGCPGPAQRRRIGVDRQFAPRQRQCQVAIRGPKLAQDAGKDQGAPHRTVRLIDDVVPLIVRQAMRSITRIREGARHEIMARALHPRDFGLGLRDPPRQMELELQCRIDRLGIGTGIGTGLGPEPTDRSRAGLDGGHECCIGQDRPRQSMTNRILRHPRFAGRRSGAGAPARVGAVRRALALAHHTGRAAQPRHNDSGHGGSRRFARYGHVRGHRDPDDRELHLARRQTIIIGLFLPTVKSCMKEAMGHGNYGPYRLDRIIM